MNIIPKLQHFYFRDFAEMLNIPRCAACDELIFATEYTGIEILQQSIQVYRDITAEYTGI